MTESESSDEDLFAGLCEVSLQDNDDIDPFAGLSCCAHSVRDDAPLNQP
jgi:hypothetical protein